jgi:hypothetical protein
MAGFVTVKKTTLRYNFFAMLFIAACARITWAAGLFANYFGPQMGKPQRESHAT